MKLGQTQQILISTCIVEYKCIVIAYILPKQNIDWFRRQTT